jgi:O-antigen/teichoic acid export membrane protein
MKVDDTKPPDAGHRLKHGAAASAASSVATVIAGLGLLPLIIDRVGASRYGVWLLLSTFATYLYQADLGMGAGLVHFLSKQRADPIDVQRRVFGTGLACMIVAGLAALPIYAVVGLIIIDSRGTGAGVDHGDGLLLLGLGGVLIACLGLRAFSSALQGHGLWVFQRQTEIVGVAVRIVGTLVACLLVRSIVAVAVAESLAALLPMLLCAAKAYDVGLARHALRRFDRETARVMIRYSSRAFFLGAMALILLQADTLIVGLVASAAAVAFYGAAFRIYITVVQALWWMTDPLMPALSRLYVTSRATATHMFTGMLFAAMWFAIGAGTTLMIVSPALFRIWLGRGAPSGELAGVLCILLVSLVVSSSHEPAIPAVDATGQPGAFAPLYVCWAASNVVLSVGLGYAVGIIGVALGTTLPVLCLEPLFLRKMSDTLGVRRAEWWQQCLKPILPLLFSGALAASVAFAAFQSIADTRVACVVASVAFGGVYLLATRLRRTTLPVESVRAVLDARL